MERHLRLLSSNVAPEQEEIAAIQECISIHTKAINQLELAAQRLGAEHQRLRAEWRKVQEKRRKVATEREALRGILTPLRRFPAEIMSEIFVATLPQVRQYCGPTWVVNLCKVSKFWRAVAIDTPRLWNHLTLRPMDLHSSAVGKVRHSGTLLRHLELQHLHGCFHAAAGNGAGCTLVKVWEVVKLLSEGPTLHSLSLKDVRSECLLELTKHMKEHRTLAARPWDSLESLEIRLSSYSLVDGSFILKHLFPSLPPVRCFQLRGLPKWGGRMQSLPTNHRLTTLVLKDLPLFTILNFVPLCTALLNLTMAPALHNSTLPKNHQPCRLPNLRALRLKNWTFEWTAMLLQLFHTPALINLDVTIYEGADNEASSHSDHPPGEGLDHIGHRPKQSRFDVVAGLASFIQRSEVGVHRLRIEDLDLTWRGFERIFNKIPTVTDLTIDFVEMDTSIFQASSLLDADHHLQPFPSLKVLRLSRMPGHFQFIHVCKFFARRIAYPQKFETIKTLILEVDLRRFRYYDNAPESGIRRAVLELRKLEVDVHVSLER